MERPCTRRILRFRFALLPVFACACASRGPGAYEPCSYYTIDERGFKFKPQLANVEVEWFEEWTSRFGETLPEPLPPHKNWQHLKSLAAGALGQERKSLRPVTASSGSSRMRDRHRLWEWFDSA